MSAHPSHLMAHRADVAVCLRCGATNQTGTFSLLDACPGPVPLTDAEVDSFLASEPPPDPATTARIRRLFNDRKHYLGDGVYVELFTHGFALSGQGRDGTTHRLLITPQVYEQLAWWVRKSIRDGSLPFSIQFKDREQ